MRNTVVIDGYSILEDDGAEWKHLGRCRNPNVNSDIFFPGKGGLVSAAKEVCSRCRVRACCLEYALVTNQRVGVWGGMSERERRRFRIQRARARYNQTK